MKKKLIVLLLALISSFCLAFGLAACKIDNNQDTDNSDTQQDGSGSQTVAVSSVTLNKTTISLVVDSYETLTAAVAPDNATDKTVTWSSSDTSVATVENGKVTAKAVGTANITATAGEQTATCVVTVTPIAVTSVTLNKTTISLVVDGYETLTAAVAPDNATNKTVTWSSSDTSVATVENGKVTAKAVGTANITATAGEQTATCVVTVYAPTEGLLYELNDDGESYSCNGIGTATATEIVIASKYNDKPVTSIGDEAFLYCIGLTSIVIPDSIISIGWVAFCYCSGLESITVVNGNNNYHSDGNCLIETATKTLIAGSKNSVIPTDGSVTSIGLGAFCGFRNLTSVIIPDSVTTIADSAFENCSELTSITIGSSVTSIGYDAFNGCSNLTSITIPNSVTSIDEYAFEDCSKLSSITIPDSVTSIGNNAFIGTAYYNDDSNWENGVLYIGKHLIKAKQTIEGDFTIKQGTFTITDDAFRYCSKLSSLTIPNSVTSIGSYTFYDCSKLSSLTIPNSVTSIGSYTFYDCSKLSSITFTGTKAQWMAISKNSKWNEGTGEYNVHCTDGDLSKAES